MRKRDLIAAAVGGLAATVLAGGVAWAAIPGPGEVYTACMLKNVGTVRLIDKSLPPNSFMSHCKPALEIEVSWNQKGQQGLQGLQGPQGASGANGANGQDGAQGPKGDQGEPGQNGADGAPGERGLQGEQGEQGPQGEQGSPGVPGQDGVTGYEIVSSSIIDFPPGVHSMRTLLCPPGKKAVGGGVSAGSAGVVTVSRPLFPEASGEAWVGGIRNTSASETTATQLWAVCAAVS